MIQDSLQILKAPVPENSLTDWIQAIGVLLAFAGTAYGIWSTRKDGKRMQEQIDHLATLANVESQRRLQEVLPNFKMIRSPDHGDIFTYTIKNDGPPVKNVTFFVYNDDVDIRVPQVEGGRTIERGELFHMVFSRKERSENLRYPIPVDGHIEFITFDKIRVKLKYNGKNRKMRFFDPTVL